MAVPLAEYVATIVTHTQCLCFSASLCTLCMEPMVNQPYSSCFCLFDLSFHISHRCEHLVQFETGCLQFGSLFACSVRLRYMGIHTCILKMCAKVPRAVRGSISQTVPEGITNASPKNLTALPRLHYLSVESYKTQLDVSFCQLYPMGP